MKLTFGCCDLALYPVTFTAELDLDVVVTYLHAKNEVNRSSCSKFGWIEKNMKLLAAVTLHLIHDLHIRTWPTYGSNLLAC